MTIPGLVCTLLSFLQPFVSSRHSLSLCDASEVSAASRATEDVVALKVHTKQRVNNTAPLLGGLFFEDISQSGDGGIYAELIRNRAFQGSGVRLGHIPNIPYGSIVYSENPIIPFGPVLDGWSGIGNVRLSLDSLHQLSDALLYSLQVDIPTDAEGIVGIKNEGFWGMSVTPQTYQASFHVQPNGARFNWTALTHFNVSLRADLTDDIWCEASIPLGKKLSPHKHTKLQAILENTATAPNINNSFAITMDASQARGQTFYFSLVSLFPETYKGRPNGLRKDLAEALEGLRPRYLRFPGGNQLEGFSIQSRWKWWKTIGPLETRPGRPGNWEYYNTDGLGLLEYLWWCEDMDMEPLLAVYAGFSLDTATYDSGNASQSNEVPWEDMDDVLQEALDELEYVMGSIDTYWGAQRAKHGHPEPFNLKMIQIGNEDFFSRQYPDRAEYMLRGLQERYPNMQYIFTALYESAEFNYDIPPGGIWDEHLYIPMQDLINQFNFFDHFQDRKRLDKVQVALMEYHASLVKLVGNSHPRMGAAVAEAVYHIGGERNPDVFRLSAFAPLLQNLNAYRHTPYDILFTSDPSETVLSTSYFQQAMFNTWHGTKTLNVTEIKGGLDPLFWVASVQEPEEEIYFKIANVAYNEKPLKITLDRPFASVNGTVLKPPVEGDPLDFNYIKTHKIVPQDITDMKIFGLHGEKLTVTWSVPAFSVAVIQFNLIGKSRATEDVLPLDQLDIQVPLKNEAWPLEDL